MFFVTFVVDTTSSR